MILLPLTLLVPACGLKRIEELVEEFELLASSLMIPSRSSWSHPTSDVGEVEADEIPELDSLTLRILEVL